MTTQYNPMQRVKRQFFALRNGVIADTLRKAGLPYRIVFGLNLPQLADVARALGPDRALALQLWADTGTRESLLLAPQLMPHAAMDTSLAAAWLAAAPTAEVADVLCLKLLRHLDCALPVALELHASPGATDMQRYSALRLMMCLLTFATASQAGALAAAIGPAARAEAAAQRPATRALAAQLLDELQWLAHDTQ